tara:strand:+ start:159878 stop:160291 length:414 start_codon:yes stop_codon:yes gene_type:complete
MAALLALSAPSPLSAQEENPRMETEADDDYGRCMDASEGITSNMMSCIGIEQERLDNIMSEKIIIIKQNLLPKKAEHLDDSQVNWLTKISKNCWKGLPHDLGYYGTLEMLRYSGCILHKTNQRIDWLNEKYPGQANE